MFSFESFRHKMQKNSEEKVKDVVYATWYGNTWIVILILLFLSDLVRLLLMKVNIYLFWMVYLSLALIAGVYMGTRKAGVALSESRVIYVKFKHIGYKEKEIYEVPFDKIKSLTVRKFLNTRFVKMSFISNMGKYVQVKYMFSSFMIGPGSSEFKKNSENVYKALKNLQKVIDKGDF